MIILAILTIADLATSVYGLITSNSQRAEINNLKQELSHQNPSDSENQNPNTPDVPNNSELSNSFIVNVKLTQANWLNPYNDKPHTFKTSLIWWPIISRGEWNYNTNSGKVTVKWEDASYILGVDSENRSGEEEFIINPADGTVTDVIFANFSSQSGWPETIFLLMEDGTVEYIHIVKALEDKSFKSQGKVPGIPGITKIWQIDSITGEQFESAQAVIAERVYGKFYDHFKIFRELGIT